jgi:hypothetical protein
MELISDLVNVQTFDGLTFGGYIVSITQHRFFGANFRRRITPLGYAPDVPSFIWVGVSSTPSCIRAHLRKLGISIVRKCTLLDTSFLRLSDSVIYLVSIAR